MLTTLLASFTFGLLPTLRRHEGEVFEAANEMRTIAHKGVAEQKASRVRINPVGLLEQAWVVADGAVSLEVPLTPIADEVA